MSLATAELQAQFIRSFFAPVDDLFCDAAVSEILINGPEEIYVERAGRLERQSSSFSDPAELERGLRAIAQYLGVPFDQDHPIIEGTLPDGSRLEALRPPLTHDHIALAIRKHAPVRLQLRDLVASGALSSELVDSLAVHTRRRHNLLVSGGTGSGKTSLLNCLASLIPHGQRIVTIEDTRELNLHSDHVLSLQSRPADARGRGQVSIGTLFRATLRLRPDRIVIGELRGPEALDLIQAMTSGHGGCMSTIHASSPFDALQRLEALATSADSGLPLSALRAQIASGVHLVLQTERLQDGRRAVTSVVRVRGRDQHDRYVLEELFRRSEHEQESGS